MHIGIDGRALSSPGTGIGVYTAEMVNEIVDQANCQVTVYSNTDLVAVNGVTCKFARIYPAARWRNGWLVEQLENDRVDVLWSPLGVLPVTWKRPSLITVHDLLWRDWPLSLGFRDLVTRVTQMKASLHMASKIIAVSDFTFERLSRSFPVYQTKTEVIRCGCGRRSLFPGVPVGRRPPRFLAFGGGRRKNLERLISAFEASRLASEGFELQVVGLRKPKAAEGVVLHGYLGESDLEELMRNTRILVVPSLYEGFGLPILEGIRRGCAVLASDIPPFREFGLGEEHFFEPRSVMSIAAALRAASQADYCESLVREQATLKFPSWSEAAKRVVQAAMKVAK